jgi:argininosuccinate lyase
VAYCEKQNKKLSDLTLEELKGYCAAIGQDVYDCLGAVNVAAKYVTEGACGPKQAQRQLACWLEQLGKR